MPTRPTSRTKIAPPPRIPSRSRFLPTHEMVGPPSLEFGKWVHYKEHTVGTFRWACACHSDIHIEVRVEKAYGAKVEVRHRSASRRFTSDDPRARDITDRIAAVTQFVNCGPTLGRWGWSL